MKSPQLEDGYTRIANELLEAFSTLDVSGSAWRVSMVVLRKTYGFNKKEDKISLTQFEKMSGLARKSVCRGLNEAIKLNVVVCKKEGYINIYSIQKDYTKWGSVKPVTSDQNDTKTSVKPVTKTSDQNDTYKRKKERKTLLAKAKNNMGWKKYDENKQYEEKSIDADTLEEIVSEETAREKQLKKLNEQIRHNLKAIEELRGLNFSAGKDMNFHVKIYRELLAKGWSHKGLMDVFIKLIESPHWVEQKAKGDFPGMNTVQSYVRNKQPI